MDLSTAIFENSRNRSQSSERVCSDLRLSLCDFGKKCRLAHGRETHERYPSITRFLHIETRACSTTCSWTWLKKLRAISSKFTIVTVSPVNLSTSSFFGVRTLSTAQDDILIVLSKISILTSKQRTGGLVLCVPLARIKGMAAGYLYFVSSSSHPRSCPHHQHQISKFRLEVLTP